MKSTEILELMKNVNVKNLDELLKFIKNVESYDTDQVLDLVKVVESHDIDEIEISKWGTKIRVSKNTGQVGATVLPAAQVPVQQPPILPDSNGVSPAPSSEILEVKTPIVGTFYHAPAPDAGPFVKVGDVVTKGQTLCIIEAMKIMNEIESPYSGKIVKILVENSQPVEFDQVLFVIE